MPKNITLKRKQQKILHVSEKKIFKKSPFDQIKDDERLITLLVLKEVGLAEKSPAIPLEV